MVESMDTLSYMEMADGSFLENPYIQIQETAPRKTPECAVWKWRLSSEESN